MPRILIVEDDTDINNSTAQYLRRRGCECVQAFSGTLATVNRKDREKASTADTTPLDKAVNIPLAKTFSPTNSSVPGVRHHHSAV